MECARILALAARISKRAQNVPALIGDAPPRAAKLSSPRVGEAPLYGHRVQR
jgi:hypothetical protein